MDLAGLDGAVARYLGTVRDTRIPERVRLHDLRHMAFWHGHYAQTVGAVAGGGEPDVLRGTYKTINRDAQACHRRLGEAALRAAIETAQTGLRRDLPRVPADRDIPYKQGSRRYARDAYVATVIEHFDMHIRYLDKIAAGAPERFYVFHD